MATLIAPKRGVRYAWNVLLEDRRWEHCFGMESQIEPDEALTNNSIDHDSPLGISSFPANGL